MINIALAADLDKNLNAAVYIIENVKSLESYFSASEISYFENQLTDSNSTLTINNFGAKTVIHKVKEEDNSFKLNENIEHQE